MYLLSTRNLVILTLSVCLLACQVCCHASSSVSGERRLSAEDTSQEQAQGGHLQPHHLLAGGEEESAEGGRRTGPCEEGWAYSHHHCLLDTGLGSVEEAEVICNRHGAEEARGICVKKSSTLSASLEAASLKEEEDEQGMPLPSSSGAGQQFVCPSGWTRYEEFCFFRRTTAPRVCGLLGANYIFNYCVTRVPHKLPTDFMQAVKRLDGSDYAMHRDTRLCCCGGHMGFCK